jgi:hypothetical protein
MYKEEVVMHFTIIRTSNGFKVEQEEPEGGYDYVSDLDGQDTFSTYFEACVVLAEHMLKVPNEKFSQAS